MNSETRIPLLTMSIPQLSQHIVNLEQRYSKAKKEQEVLMVRNPARYEMSDSLLEKFEKAAQEQRRILAELEEEITHTRAVLALAGRALVTDVEQLLHPNGPKKPRQPEKPAAQNPK